MTWPTRTALGAASCLALAATTVFCGGPEFEAATDAGSTPSLDAAPDVDANVPDVVDASDERARDAARDGRDEASVDAEVEASVDASDATTFDAADADAGPGVDASDAGIDFSAFTCAAQPSATTLFCCDFEEGETGLVPPWANAPASTGASSTLTTQLYESPSHAYLASTTASATAADAYVDDTVVSGKTTIDLGFSIYVEALDTSASQTVTLASLAFEAGSAEPELVIQLIQTGSGLLLAQTIPTADSGGSTVQLTGASLATNAWTRVRVTYDRSIPSAPTVTTTFNESKAFNTAALTSTVSSSVFFELGLVFASAPAGADRVAIDDVLVRGM